MELAVAGCRAVAEFMREQLLAHVQALALARMPALAPGAAPPGSGRS